MRILQSSLLLVLIALSAPASAASNSGNDGRVIVPRSSVIRPEDKGVRAHTHYLIFNTHGPIEPPGPKKKVAPREPSK